MTIRFLDDPDAFMEVSLNSTDPDVRETYRLLPEEMKQGYCGRIR